jgi:hypothetical protein
VNKNSLLFLYNTLKKLTKNDIKNIGILGFTPIIFGGFIYLISRPKTIFLFDWIRIIKLENASNTIRIFFAEYEFPNWVKYNLPDLLWVFAFTSVMLIIWKGIDTKFKNVYVFSPLFIGIISEFLQYFNPKFGTFDIMDIVFYSLGSIISISILKP